MGKALRYRLLHVGRMPGPLKTLTAAGDVLFADEGLSIKFSVRDLKQPRTSVGHGTKLLVGSIVATRERLLLAVGDRVILDTGAGEPDAGRGALLTLTKDGVHITFDVAQVTAGPAQASGAGELHIRFAAPPDLLAAWPASSPVELQNVGPALLDGWKGKRSV